MPSLLLRKSLYLTILRCSVRSRETRISVHLFLKTVFYGRKQNKKHGQHLLWTPENNFKGLFFLHCMYQEAVMHLKIHGGLLATEVSRHVIQLLTLCNLHLWVHLHVACLISPRGSTTELSVGHGSSTAFLVQGEGATMSTCCSWVFCSKWKGRACPNMKIWAFLEKRQQWL